MGEIEEHYKKATGTTVTAEFGPSGLLRERIEKGEHVDLFASADMGHPLKLLKDGRAIRVAMFTRNTLCLYPLPQVGLTTENFLDHLRDPAVGSGSAPRRQRPTPPATIRGRMFRRAMCYLPGQLRDPQRQGAADRRRPLKDGPVDGKDPTVAALASGRVHIVIGYCTSAKLRLSQMAELQVRRSQDAVSPQGPK